MSGKLLVVEGLDGCGKTTQVARLRASLEQAGVSLRQIKLPDYGDPSSTLVQMYLNGDFGREPGDVNAYAASAFYAVDRFASFTRHWKADYEAGKLILADRYTTSNVLYQMVKLPQAEWDRYLAWLRDFEYGKLGIPEPDLVLYLDVPVEVSQQLLSNRYKGDEQKKDIHEGNIRYLRTCREAALYACEKLHFCRIDCSYAGELLEETEVARQIFFLREKGDAFMLTFQSPRIEDQNWVKELFSYSQFQGCEYTFGNLYIWNPIYSSKITRFNDFFISKSTGSKPSYVFPAGRGDLKKVIEAMLDDAHGSGHPFRLHGVTKEAQAALEEILPGAFEYQPYRDGFDYIYNTQDLISLSGRKYHGKRNHIAYFQKTYDWHYEPITTANIGDCMRMNAEWEQENLSKNPEGISEELAAIHRAFDHYFELGFIGGLVRADGRVVAYTVGEELTDNTFCTHIEKAFADVRGAYPIINREFAANALGKYAFVNREEDMGEEGLRKAKLSYYPAILLEKQEAIYRGDL